ncbi:hypothetical protein AX15_005494 [Amanita polypyramis BW_CC]|nr:hypothetical protein AX15_005494 [Amanita polypyramis BW_CC]
MTMAAVQQFYPYPQGKGTLLPGQTIVVNKYTIQVERYLSQGGFAHVYLVRTATPVHNTTHHVLKRIAVADQSMLAEVKREVDIMRLLKGHPNIVHFIDAAWHKTPNGLFEVFILMEYCPGGGIIDMMNRRLRERLTETEILQIFVDVCEAVACMHNLRPPLLHRDLKVENILQSSQTSYKLCDFGSATAVSKPPSNMQELRLLEADLNKHTTMQYRAPEMIDVHMRRPVDEKSDVWALGVLLYKLCYYTTPFEEHGPLAILQVSYKIPPYPVYSKEMNVLIGKMLKDHGTIRPTIFAVLAEVHRMRGTRSQFQYAVPIPQPLSPSRHAKHPTLSALDGVITYKPSRSPHKHQSSASVSPAKNQGQLARDKVMEAIEPMRRGRPSPSKDLSRESRPNSRQSSPQKDLSRQIITGDRLKPNVNEINLTSDEKVWKSFVTNAKQSTKQSSLLDDDAWKVASGKENVQVNTPAGFGDNFGEKLRSPAETSTSHVDPKPMSVPKFTSLYPPSMESSMPVRHTPQSATGTFSRKVPLPRTEKDAFEGLGLGLPSEKPAPTLGEARKLRTGLAIMSVTRPNRAEGESRPSASPRPSYLTPQAYMQTQGFLSTSPSNASSTSSLVQAASRPPSSTNIDGMPTESRFPSLEELDATFSKSARLQSSARPPASVRQSNVTIPQSATLREQTLNDATPIKPVEAPVQEKQGSSHTRVFGFANNTGDSLRLDKGRALPSTLAGDIPPRRVSSLSLKPTITRRHRTSISFKHRPSKDDNDTSIPLQPQPSLRNEVQLPPSTPPTKLPTSPRDWITGDENIFSPSTPSHTSNAEMPVLRQSPSKRASVIEKSDFVIQEPEVAQPEEAAVVNGINESTTITKFTQHFPPIEKDLFSDTWNTSAAKESADSSSSSADEGPEDANGLPAAIKSGSSGRQSHKRRQSSVHDLVDLWGGSGKDIGQGIKHEEKAAAQERQKLAGPSSTLKASYTSMPMSSSPESKTSSHLEPATTSSELSKKLTSGRTSPSTRPRPQSLFLLPLRSTDVSPPKSHLLEAPQEVKRRQSMRRTSITDMVERYEAMGGHPKSVVSRPPSPHAIKKSSSSKSTPQVLEVGRVLRALDTGASLSVPPSPSTPSAKQSVSPTRLQRTGAGISSSPLTERRVFPDGSKSLGVSDVHELGSTERTVSRPRRLSLKPHENSKPPVSLQDLLATNEKEKPLHVMDRSPSPERSYQGVGKLIDQWQRKAEAADSRTPVGLKRSSVITKRPATAGKGQ